MSVNVNDIKENLMYAFEKNSMFNKDNIGKDNTVEDKTLSFILKLSSMFNLDLNNFYKRLESFKLEGLSIYSNSGSVVYEPLENTGKISPLVLKNDDENTYNIDNLYGQIMLMLFTSNDNYYGFGSERSLDSLNKTCTYMISSNLFGSSENNDFEEELTLLNLMDLSLGATNSRLDFITAYLSNNGPLLKEELNKIGISDNILNEINYLHEAKLNGRDVPDIFSRVLNDINKSLIKQNPSIFTEDFKEKYYSNLLNDNCYKYSKVGITNASENAKRAMEYVTKNNIVNINDYRTMQKTA